MEALVAALVVGTAGVLAALIQRSDRRHEHTHDALGRDVDSLQRDVEGLRADNAAQHNEIRQELRQLRLRIDRLYGPIA